jgi:hypothetical protein
MRNKTPNADGKFPAVNATYSDVVLGYIRREFAPLRHAAELLARIADATPRAAKCWLNGEHAPNGEKLVTLLANRPDLEGEFIDLVRRRRAALRARSIENLARAERILGGHE